MRAYLRDDVTKELFEEVAEAIKKHYCDGWGSTLPNGATFFNQHWIALNDETIELLEKIAKNAKEYLEMAFSIPGGCDVDSYEECLGCDNRITEDACRTCKACWGCNGNCEECTDEDVEARAKLKEDFAVSGGINGDYDYSEYFPDEGDTMGDTFESEYADEMPDYEYDEEESEHNCEECELCLGTIYFDFQPIYTEGRVLFEEGFKEALIAYREQNTLSIIKSKQEEIDKKQKELDDLKAGESNKKFIEYVNSIQ